MMKTKYEIGDIVYLKTDTEQLPRMVTGILFRINYPLYELAQGPTSAWHYEMEINNEVDEMIKMKNY